MKIEWSAKSRDQLKQIHEYFSEVVDEELADSIISDLIDKAEQLNQNPFSGTKEFLLSDRKEDFRYLVLGNYKLIYFVDNRVIRIISVFDCRQEPQKLLSHSSASMYSCSPFQREYVLVLSKDIISSRK